MILYVRMYTIQTRMHACMCMFVCMHLCLKACRCPASPYVMRMDALYVQMPQSMSVYASCACVCVYGCARVCVCGPMYECDCES